MRASLIVLALLSSGCASFPPPGEMTTGQKVAVFVGVALVTGYIVSEQDKGPVRDQRCYDIRPPGSIIQVLCR